MIADETIHPMLRALWAPRLMEAIDWIAEQVATNRDAGRLPIIAEGKGEAMVAGVKLHGRADRIDRLADGRLAIIDYKTGKAPAKKAVAEGFALQLGLLSLIARAGGFKDVQGDVGGHEYWSLAKDKGTDRLSPFAGQGRWRRTLRRSCLRPFRGGGPTIAARHEPFEAKLNPAYAPYEDYDQLMRLEEWYGRD